MTSTAGNFTHGLPSTSNMYPEYVPVLINNQGQFLPVACVLGFHTFFARRVTPQPRWVFNFASWISRGSSGWVPGRDRAFA